MWWLSFLDVEKVPTGGQSVSTADRWLFCFRKWKQTTAFLQEAVFTPFRLNGMAAWKLLLKPLLFIKASHPWTT